MRRIFKLSCIVLLSFVIVFAFTSCKNKTDDSTDTTPSIESDGQTDNSSGFSITDIFGSSSGSGEGSETSNPNSSSDGQSDTSGENNSSGQSSQGNSSGSDGSSTGNSQITSTPSSSGGIDYNDKNNWTKPV